MAEARQYGLHACSEVRPISIQKIKKLIAAALLLWNFASKILRNTAFYAKMDKLFSFVCPINEQRSGLKG